MNQNEKASKTEKSPHRKIEESQKKLVKLQNPSLFFSKGERWSDFFLLGGLLLALTALIGFPSYKIAKFEEGTPPPGLPDSLESGSLFLIDAPAGAYQIRVNGRLLTSLFEEVYLLGGIGIKQRNEVILSGFYTPPPQEKKQWFLSSPFAHPTLYGFNKKIPVSPESEIEKAAPLRLPTSVWKKVSQNHPHRKKIESLRLRKVLRHRSEFTQFSCWDPPLNTKVTSPFGTPRTLPNGRSYYHSGVDLRARIGTPILAMGGGRVVLAQKMMVPGNIVVLDHGGGLFSRYFHLNQIQVAEGKNVLKGQQLGRAGATGRVNGPHLHWEIIWKGLTVDPFQAIQTWRKICENSHTLRANP